MDGFGVESPFMLQNRVITTTSTASMTIKCTVKMKNFANQTLQSSLCVFASLRLCVEPFAFACAYSADHSRTFAATAVTFATRRTHGSKMRHSAASAGPVAVHKKCQFSALLPHARLSFRRIIDTTATTFAFCLELKGQPLFSFLDCPNHLPRITFNRRILLPIVIGVQLHRHRIRAGRQFAPLTLRRGDGGEGSSKRADHKPPRPPASQSSDAD